MITFPAVRVWDGDMWESERAMAVVEVRWCVQEQCLGGAGGDEGEKEKALPPQGGERVHRRSAGHDNSVFALR